VPVEHDSVDWSAVPALDDVELGEEQRSIHGRVPTVDTVADERLRYVGRKANASQPDPQVPIFTEPILSVKALGQQRLSFDDDAGTAAWDGIETMEHLRDLFRCAGRGATEDAMILRDVDCPCICPAPASRAKSLELKKEFVWRPDIIIVEERHPLPLCFGNPSVPGGRLSKWRLVAD
jgi:hypothetical protein